MVDLPGRRCEMAKKFMYVCLGILAVAGKGHCDVGAEHVEYSLLLMVSPGPSPTRHI
jgi:hypothetical protein